MSKDEFLRNDPNDSVSKSLRILLLLGANDSVGVSEVSRELSVAVSTAHRLLNIMRQHGFVEQDRESRRYRLGAAALQLGHKRRGEPELLSISRPLLVRLGAELKETVDLLVLDGAEALFVDGVQSCQFPRVATRTGQRVPAYATAGGKAILAQLSYLSLRSQYPDELRRLTRFTHADLTSLEEELNRIRLRGFALDRGEYHAEVRSIAVTINDSSGRAVAALAVIGPSARWGIRKLKSVAPDLAGVAAEISQSLPPNDPDKDPQ